MCQEHTLTLPEKSKFQFGGVKMAVIVKSAVKDCCKGFNVSADFYDALDKEVQNTIKRASQRAKDNGRKTVQARDI